MKQVYKQLLKMMGFNNEASVSGCGGTGGGGGD